MKWGLDATKLVDVNILARSGKTQDGLNEGIRATTARKRGEVLYDVQGQCAAWWRLSRTADGGLYGIWSGGSTRVSREKPEKLAEKCALVSRCVPRPHVKTRRLVPNEKRAKERLCCGGGPCAIWFKQALSPVGLCQCFSTAGPQPGTGPRASIIAGRERFCWNLSL